MLHLHSFNTIFLLRFVAAVATHLLFCIFLRFVLLFSNSIWTLPDSGARKKSTHFCLVVDAFCFGLKSCKALLKEKHTIDQENVKRSKIKKKGEMTGCQVASK